MITWIASYPRSGNRFFRTVLRETYGIDSLDMYAKLPDPIDGWLTQADAEANEHYVKTHDLPRGDRYPAIYLVRDGRDALVSYAWFSLRVFQNKRECEIDPALFHATLRNLIESQDRRFGHWSNNVLTWRQRPNTAIARFEDLVGDAAGTVYEAMAAIGRPVSRAVPTTPTFDSMRAANPTLVRRGKIGSWVDEFPADLLPRFWELHGNAMEAFGYYYGTAQQCAAA